MIKITEERLSIRDLKLSDLETLSDWMHPEQNGEVNKLPDDPRSTEKEIAATTKKWEQTIITKNLPALRQCLLIVNSLKDVIIEMVSRNWISKETNWTAIGISIYDPKNWGKGYGYGSLGLWCQYLFDNEPKFVRLDFRTWSGNIGMMKVAKILGWLPYSGHPSICVS